MANKIVALTGFVMPSLYFLMFLPIWNGNELTMTPIDVFDIIQTACLIAAAVNLFLTFIKKDSRHQSIFTVVMIISACITCFFGIFFVEKLMGIPLFPPQD